MTKTETEKPQWTTKQVITFVGSLALILGIGGTKAVDAVTAQPEMMKTESATTQDIRELLDQRIGYVRGDLKIMQQEFQDDRIENSTDHMELRKTASALAREVHAMRNDQTLDIRMDRINKVASRNAE